MERGGFGKCHGPHSGPYDFAAPPDRVGFDASHRPRIQRLHALRKTVPRQAIQ